MNLKQQFKEFFDIKLGDVDKTIPFSLFWGFVKLNVRIEYKPSTGYMKVSII